MLIMCVRREKTLVPAVCQPLLPSRMGPQTPLIAAYCFMEKVYYGNIDGVN